MGKLNIKGDLKVDGDLGFTATGIHGYITSTGLTSTITTGTPANLLELSTLADSYRYNWNADNTNKRFTYTGANIKKFIFNVSFTMQSNANIATIAYLYKNGVECTGTSTYVNTTNGLTSASINYTVYMDQNQYIELWGQPISSSAQISVQSLNMLITEIGS